MILVIGGTGGIGSELLRLLVDAAVAATAGFDFSEADQVPPEKFNRVSWMGLMHGKAYPERAMALLP